MFKKLLAKIGQMVFFQKVKAWLIRTGVTNVLYLVLAIAALIAPIGKFLSLVLFGAFLGIFAYINWNVVRKIWKEKIRKK